MVLDNENLLFKAKELLLDDLEQITYNMIAKPLEIVDYQGNTVVLALPTSSQKFLLFNNYLNIFENVFSTLTNKSIELKVIESSEIAGYKSANEELAKTMENKYPNLNPLYTFDNFVVGDNNNMAEAASQKVATSPGGWINPLFIYGGPGLGKTHLMQAIANKIIENNPSTKVIYVSSENFLNDLVNSIKNRERDTEEFRQKYRNVDVFLMDDVQFLSGKDSAQQELFNTFNTLHQMGKQIIFSADKPPKDIPVLEQRLVSRFNQGLIVDITQPAYETRLAILKQKAEEKNIIVEDSILQLIAEKVDTNIRDLEGVLNKVTTFAMLTGPITIEMTEKAINEVALARENVITSTSILEVVSNYFNIPKKDILSSKKSKEIVFPRQIAMYLCRSELNLPYKKVGDIFGKKDHTTIIYAENKIKNSINNDRNTQLIVESVENILKNLGQ